MVTLAKGSPTPWPRIESDNHIMTTGSTKPLEDAFRIAHSEMVHWVSDLTSQSTLDSYQFVSQTALTPVANVVDTNYTMVAKVAKDYLGNVNVMQGMHQKMRARAAQWHDYQKGK